MKLAALTFVVFTLAAQEFPQAEISNGPVTARLYLPDAERGYYRGTRFDWSGQIYSLKAGGHEYFGQWFERYDPKLHDAIMGPVEEFGNLGYDEAKPGATFVRIGVGALRKPEEREYGRFKTYEIVDPGKWTVNAAKDRVTMTHVVGGGRGYEYTKTIRLTRGRPEMTIEHALKNTGTRTIRTQQYNHNFFVIDGKPAGPGASVEFPFNLKPVRNFQGDAAAAEGGRIRYNRELQKGQSVYGEFEGSGRYDMRIENQEAGAGVHIRGDLPVAKLVFWSIRTTLCPEPYVDIVAEPGKQTKWTYTYGFYNLSGAAPPAR